MIIALVWLVIELIVIMIAVGGITWLIRKAPIDGEPFKSWIIWFVYAIGILAAILALANFIPGHSLHY